MMRFEQVEHALFVPFRLDAEALAALRRARGEALLGRFEERWAAIGVLVIASVTAFRQRLDELLREPDLQTSNILRDIARSIGRKLPVCEEHIALGAGLLAHPVDPLKWENGALGRVFTARVCSRGADIRREILPGMLASEAMIAVDGYLAAPAQVEGLRALGGLVAYSGVRHLECWCVHTAHFRKETQNAPLTRESARETWRQVATPLQEGGAPGTLRLTIQAYAPAAFGSRTHDRLLVLGHPSTIGGRPPVGSHLLRVVAVGPGIRALSDEPDVRQDTAARLDAACFARLRAHFDAASEPPLRERSTLSAL